MVPVQRDQVPSQQSLAVFLENPPAFLQVVAGTEGSSMRRWNCGGRRAARLCRSLDFSLESQVVSGTGDDALPGKLETGRRWEKKPTRCDPKCGQRVGAVAAVLEDDRLSMVLEAGVLEDDLGYSMSEDPLPGAPGEDVLNGTKSEVLHCENTSGGDVFEVLRSGANEMGSMESVVLGQSAHRVAGTTCGLAGSGVGRRRRAAQRPSVGVPTASAPPWWVVRVRPAQRAEAGSDTCHSFASPFERCESHIARSHRVNVTLHENLLCTSSGCRNACTTHNSLVCDTGVHDAMQHVIRLGRKEFREFV